VSRLKLEHQAFTQVTSGHSRRMKGLHDLKHSLNLAARPATGKHQFIHARLQEAAVIDVANDQLGDLELLFAQI